MSSSESMDKLFGMLNPEIYHPEDEEYLDFQKLGIQELITRPNVLLGDEMGLGKTIQVIGYMNLVKPSKVLIICPNNLRINWISEIEKWMDPALRATYEIEQCTPSLYLESNFIICSFEGLTKWGPVLKNLDLDLLVIDEMHYIKNMSTKRARALFEFQDKDCKKIGLTGTPICNYPYEIFPLINFLDPQQWPSKSLFERRYCPYGNKYGYHLDELQKFLRNGGPRRVVKSITRTKIVKTKVSNNDFYICDNCPETQFQYESDAIQHATETKHTVSFMSTGRTSLMPVEEVVDNVVEVEQGVGVMVRRQKKDVLKELPRKRRQIIELPSEGELLELVEKENALWKGQADLIKQLEEALGTYKESTNDDDFENLIDSLKFTRRYFFDEIAIIRHALAKAKVPYVCEHIEDLLENKDKLVCFVHHNDVGRLILDKFQDRAVLVMGPTSMDDRATAIKRFWNDDKVELFIGSLKTSGIGINLQCAANIVFAELDWVPGVITQAEDRCHRIGQEKSLLVQHLVAQNSMDSNMAKKIVAKQKSIQKALNKGVGE